MKAVRLWSTRNAGWLKKCYAALENTLALFNPLLKAIDHERLDKPFAAVQGAVKSFLFDSQSCGQCTLGETGMACSMNCPKTLRNGPHGGVRQNGGCEIKPEMTCVWVNAREGNQKVGAPLDTIKIIQPPVENRLKGRSAWARKNVSGVHIPDDVIKRLAGTEDQKQEGVKLCVDLIEQVRKIECVSGVRIMAYRMEDRIGEIVTRSNALGGRKPWQPVA